MNIVIINNFFRQNSVLLLLFCVPAFIFSCTQKYAEYNTNPYRVTLEQQQPDNYYIGQRFPNMINAVTPAGDVPGETDFVNSYQTAINLSSDCYAGFMGQAGDWASNSNNLTYNFISSWNNNQFTLLGKLIAPWSDIKDYATNEVDGPLLLAVANVIRAIGVIRTTDSFGPIPFSDIASGTSTPAFDSQDSIYYSVLEDLKSSRDLLNQYGASAGKPLQKFDLIYAGDYTKWAKLANSLILRYAMRIVYANEAKAKQYAEEAVANAAGLLSTAVDDAVHSIKGGNGGFNYSNPLVVLTNIYKEARAGASIVSVLTGYNDPRLGAYFNDSQLEGYKDEVVGIRSGSIITRVLYEPFSALKVDYTTPMPWMRSSETYFLRAEGVIRGWNMGGTAQNFYEEGIKMAFKESDATIPLDYLNDNSLVPVKYIDPVATTNSGEMDYNDTKAETGVDNWTIKWDDGANFETKLHRIIIQKWISLYMNGPEAWAEYRRTGYPRLLTVSSADIESGVDPKFQVRRIPYPSNQYSENGAEVSKAITLLGGVDNGGTRLWWDKKSNIPK